MFLRQSKNVVLLLRSGAVVRNSLLDASEGGTRIQVPEFNPIAPTEEILDGTATWGTSNAGYLTPQKIGTGTQIATICHRGFAYAVDDVAVLAAGEDPMGHIRNQIADAINKLNSARLFSSVRWFVWIYFRTIRCKRTRPKCRCCFWC